LATQQLLFLFVSGSSAENTRVLSSKEQSLLWLGGRYLGILRLLILDRDAGSLSFRHGRLVEVGVNNGVVLLLGPLALLLLLILALLQLHHHHGHGHALAGEDGDDDGDAVVNGAMKVHL